MMYKKLVIIGNGFDLNFGLPTRYSDFENFIQKYHPVEKRNLEELYFTLDLANNSLWSDFENNLSFVDKDFICRCVNSKDDAESVYGFINESSKVVKGLFEKWVRSISCKVNTHYKNLIPGVFVINFNYTLTLEENFRVNDNQVYHIHGTTKDDIIFGHEQGMSIQKKPEYYDLDVEDFETYNVFEPAVINWLNKYLLETEKPTDQNIKKSQKFLENKYNINFNNIEEIFIIGLSCSDADLPYLRWLTEKTNAKWYIGYYNNEKAICENINKIPLNNYILKTNSELIDRIFV